VTDLSAWFETTWKQLPAFLFTSQTKGSKKLALDELKKIKPSDETLLKIREWLKSKEEIDKQLKNTQQFVAPWSHFHRMIKREFWQDDLPTLKTKRARGAAGKCPCGNDIDHADGICWACYDKKYGNSMCGTT
jgi:hypothetical protein